MGLAGFTNAPSISAFVAIGLTVLAIARILTTKDYHLSIWIDDVYRCQILFYFLWTVPLIIGVVLDYIFLKDSGSSGGRAGAGLYSSIVCILILVLLVLAQSGNSTFVSHLRRYLNLKIEANT